MNRSPVAGKRSRRTHNLGGCDTCRKRHVKCDQTRPRCLNCQAVATVCSGYHSKLKWMVAAGTPNVEDTTHDTTQAPLSQTHILTEESRKSMSITLRSELGGKSVDQSILELDARSKNAISASDESVGIGPFMCFALPAQNVDAPVDLLGSVDNSVAQTSRDIEVAALSVESFESQNDLLGWEDLFDLDFELTIPDLDYVEHQLEEGNPLPQQQPLTDSLCLNHEITPTHDIRSPTTWLEELKPANIGRLLDHFKKNVIAQLVSIPLAGKSVWDVTIITSALLTLAKITYMTSMHVSRAELATLLAVCAMSATHLATHKNDQDEDTSSYWVDVADKSLQEARKELQCSFQKESHGENVAKYKDQLMAVCAMICHSILYDNQHEARTYLFEAERLLRRRGLAKKYISRKARLLHHVYSWTRIIGESTYVLHNHEQIQPRIACGSVDHVSNRRQPVCSEKGLKVRERRDGNNPRLDDFLRLEPNRTEAETSDTDQAETDLNIYDIHYEDSRPRTGTLYMHLYGISENWLSLVSQTTRLANEEDNVRVRKIFDAEILDSLERRKTKLEHVVCTFAMSDSDLGQLDDTAGGFVELRSCMIRAFNSALVIFFYRRIRNISPWILNEHVDKVVRALKDFTESCHRHRIPGPGSPWPSFMAGCEAMTSVHREFFRSWFDCAINTTGFTRFQAAKACMIEVWEYRDSHNGRDSMCSWVDMLREKRAHVMLA